MTICALVGASEFNAEHFQMMDAEGRSTMSSPSTVGSRILRPSGVRLIWRWGILTLSVTSRASPPGFPLLLQQRCVRHGVGVASGEDLQA